MREVRYATLETFEERDGMTFWGVAIPYGQVVTIRGADGTGLTDYDEVFHKGAFARTLNARKDKPVPLLQSHDYLSWGIGYAEQLSESDVGLEGTWHLSDVQAGREASVLIHDRVVTGLSIGFEPVANRVTRAAERDEERDLVERREVKLHEISLCQFPAYDLAAVSGQRSQVGRSLTDLAQTRDQLLDRFGRIRRWP